MAGVAMPPSLAWWASSLQLSGLNAERAEVARQFLSRATQLDPRLREQMAYRIAGDVASGRLAVTYRWLTFLDGRHHNDVSARVSNALFLAADPATPATAYQAFVQDLYHHQSSDGPTNSDIAAMARESGVPEVVADRIATGDNAVDAATGTITARATITPVVMSAAVPCTPIRALARAVSGIVSVGLNAVWLVSET